MTKEEKEILTQDLCARLPYNVKVAIDFQSYIACLPDDKDLEYPYRKNLNFILGRENKTIEDISMKPNILYAYPCKGRFLMFNGYTYQEDYGVPVEFIKPYLRPLSGMTEEEKETYEMLLNEDGLLNTSVGTYLEWVLENHFDYRGLIPMGLAVEAPEGMYK
jgi:hypothetical protein